MPAAYTPGAVCSSKLDDSPCAKMRMIVKPAAVAVSNWHWMSLAGAAGAVAVAGVAGAGRLAAISDACRFTSTHLSCAYEGVT